ncbi:MAG TPA: BTAD domain-containing putative transcriptional regulator [Solirubrobacteraceae bacterium]|nr:BTAD domain-containing putative transcriptional regulator [Solirubrobacteraceae bacterium]
MSLAIRLLGKPQLQRDKVLVSPRARKTWALLAYLLLCERPPPRSRVASVLFSEAEDPLGALRWSLADLRRTLGAADTVVGDPLELKLPLGASVDVIALTAPGEEGSFRRPEGELLEGMTFPTCSVFESWLGVMRRQLDGAARAMMHDEALARLAAGDTARASELAGYLVSEDPLDQAGQELLIRCLARSGRGQAAERQLAECEALFRRELGVLPGPELRSAATEDDLMAAKAVGDSSAALAQLEAGRAALDAGAVEPGVQILRQACAEAAASGDAPLHARCLAALGAALVHGVRGRDEEGALRLHEALRLAEACGERATVAAACRELGYVDVQAGRGPSAGRWLTRATELADGNEELCSVLGVRGMALSDRAHYGAALDLLNRSVARAERCDRRRQAAWSLSLIGRIHLLRGELSLAVPVLDECLALVAADRWTAFRPWPDSLRAEASLLMGRPDEAAERLDHAFRLACGLGDPCWEAMGARLTGLLAADAGDAAKAREHLADATARATRVSDVYQWVHAHVLDTSAALAVDTGDDDAVAIVDRLAKLAERCGMRELVVRAHAHRAQLGDPGSLEAARLLATEIDNPMLDALVAAVPA